MKFRSVILLAVAALVAGLVVLTVGSVALVLERAARRDAGEDLGRGARVFEDLQAFRASLNRTNARVVAEEPRLKAVVDTTDVTHETVLGVAQDLKKAMQSDLFVLTDGTGHLVADVADPEAQGFDLGGNPVVKAALADGEAAGVWIADGRAYQVSGRRLTFGTTTVGALVIGYVVDDRVADTVQRQTADALVVLLDGKPIASSVLDENRRAGPKDLAELAAVVGAAPFGEVGEVRLAGERFLATARAYPNYAGQAQLRYVLLRSLDRALEPRRRVLTILVGVAAIGLIAALLLAFGLARRLSRPIDDLVAFTRRVGGGDLEARAEAAGPVELRHLGESMNAMVAELFTSRRELANQERLQRELEIATRIQTSILPREQVLPGLELAAIMEPAEEVGGDYYDVLPVEGGRGGVWIGIGDVAGHGLTAGLVMMMIQSIVAALVRERPEAKPRELLLVLNAVLYDNIRVRLLQDEHVTLSLLRLLPDGTISYAGAHEEFVVWRAKTGKCERMPTPGTWLGATPDISRHTSDSAYSLDPGDLLVLYTDGLIQAMKPDGEQYGMERLEAVVADNARQPARALVQSVLGDLNRFTSERADDVTLLVVRYLGHRVEGA